MVVFDSKDSAVKLATFSKVGIQAQNGSMPKAGSQTSYAQEESRSMLDEVEGIVSLCVLTSYSDDGVSPTLC